MLSFPENLIEAEFDITHPIILLCRGIYLLRLLGLFRFRFRFRRETQFLTTFLSHRSNRSNTWVFSGSSLVVPHYHYHHRSPDNSRTAQSTPLSRALLLDASGRDSILHRILNPVRGFVTESPNETVDTFGNTLVEWFPVFRGRKSNGW
mmetsp:Transcript_2229/g.4234  ORF Transcript_2229/g.4234 Transcript_2229/m.4234 type:complete len:149 (-) Transcript_2229:840-1286(-)